MDVLNIDDFASDDDSWDGQIFLPYIYETKEEKVSEREEVVFNVYKVENFVIVKYAGGNNMFLSPYGAVMKYVLDNWKYIDGDRMSPHLWKLDCTGFDLNYFYLPRMNIGFPSFLEEIEYSTLFLCPIDINGNDMIDPYKLIFDYTTLYLDKEDLEQCLMLKCEEYRFMIENGYRRNSSKFIDVSYEYILCGLLIAKGKYPLNHLTCEIAINVAKRLGMITLHDTVLTFILLRSLDNYEHLYEVYRKYIEEFHSSYYLCYEQMVSKQFAIAKYSTLDHALSVATMINSEDVHNKCLNYILTHVQEDKFDCSYNVFKYVQDHHNESAEHYLSLIHS